MGDICPFMSIGKNKPEHCIERCALFDTELKECAFSRINGNTKSLNDIEAKLGTLSSAIEQLELTIKMNK